MGSEDAIFEAASREVSIPNPLHSSIALTGSIYDYFKKPTESWDVGKTLILNKLLVWRKKKKKSKKGIS